MLDYAGGADERDLLEALKNIPSSSARYERRPPPPSRSVPRLIIWRPAPLTLIEGPPPRAPCLDLRLHSACTRVRRRAAPTVPTAPSPCSALTRSPLRASRSSLPPLRSTLLLGSPLKTLGIEAERQKQARACAAEATSPGYNFLADADDDALQALASPMLTGSGKSPLAERSPAGGKPSDPSKTLLRSFEFACGSPQEHLAAFSEETPDDQPASSHQSATDAQPRRPANPVATQLDSEASMHRSWSPAALKLARPAVSGLWSSPKSPLRGLAQSYIAGVTSPKSPLQGAMLSGVPQMSPVSELSPLGDLRPKGNSPKSPAADALLGLSRLSSQGCFSCIFSCIDEPSSPTTLLDREDPRMDPHKVLDRPSPHDLFLCGGG